MLLTCYCLSLGTPYNNRSHCQQIEHFQRSDRTQWPRQQQRIIRGSPCRSSSPHPPYEIPSPLYTSLVALGLYTYVATTATRHLAAPNLEARVNHTNDLARSPTDRKHCPRHYTLGIKVTLFEWFQRLHLKNNRSASRPRQIAGLLHIR